LLNQKRAIIWDLDGTIVDTQACHLYTWESALKLHGFQLDRDVFALNFGRNNTTLLPALLGFAPEGDLMNAIIERKESLFRDMAADWVTLVPGVTSWLSHALGLNLRQAIASSAPMENINTMLTIFTLNDYFTSIVSGADLPAKPEPDVFLHAAETLQVSPEDCLVIEDSVAGVAGAHNAGMRCIAVATTRSPGELGQADQVVEDFNTPLHQVLQALGWD